jgi:hypothetical protein
MTEGRKPRPADWTPQEIALFKKMIADGESYLACSVALVTRGRNACRKRAIKLGIASSHQDDQWRVVSWTPELDAEIERLWLMKMSHAEIAEALKLGPTSVQGRITELNFVSRHGPRTGTMTKATLDKIRANSLRSIFRGDRREVGDDVAPESPNKLLARPKMAPGHTETAEEFMARGGVVVRGEPMCCAPINSGRGHLEFSVMR